MRNRYNSLKSELLTLAADLSALLEKAKSIPGMNGQGFAEWERTCNSIPRQLDEEIFRVAVVGSIKSGKSTFVNSLLGRDYLKRGAGVVTSIVTRVRGGDALAAELFFKSWDDINDDINDALVLFPSMSWRSGDDHQFDLRRKQDRLDLDSALGELGSESLIKHGQRTANSVLLSCYLKGYEEIQAAISTEIATQKFISQRFADHRRYVADDAFAVYLKDVQLAVTGDRLDANLEIADCQGSDSPNPLHLTMIQDYLVKTHFIIYVISSRTGLRQADIRFLSMIKKMGVMENIIFILNCDFNEHEELADLERVVNTAKEELSSFITAPEVYCLSALYNLFCQGQDDLSEKDRLKYEQWRGYSELVAHTDHEGQLFEATFERKVTRERYALMTRTHLERLWVTLAGVGQWIHVNRDVLSRDSEEARRIIEKITAHTKTVEQLKSMVKSTLNGAVGKIKNEARTEVDRFFDHRSGPLTSALIEHIRGFRFSTNDYERELEATGFKTALYAVFQEFKHYLDTYMAETVNPAVVEFINAQEEKIRSDLSAIAGPYDAMVKEALSDYTDTIEKIGITALREDFGAVDPPDIQSVKANAGLSLPPAVASLRYSVKIKTEAVMRFGLYAVVKRFKKLLKKSSDSKRQDAIEALKIGVKRMKRETEKSILSLLTDYRESAKFQYLFKLIDLTSDSLYYQLIERFQGCVTDLSEMTTLVGDHGKDKVEASQILARMSQSYQDIREHIQQVKGQIAHNQSDGPKPMEDR
jgi:GTPase SAR1 family protein